MVPHYADSLTQLALYLAAVSSATHTCSAIYCSICVIYCVNCVICRVVCTVYCVIRVSA